MDNNFFPECMIFSNDGVIQPVFGTSSVSIPDSHRVASRRLMVDTLIAIQDDPRCPLCITRRSLWSLRREWEAHNLLYSLGILRSHTATVDLDNEPLLRLAAYHILGAIYRLIHITNK